MKKTKDKMNKYKNNQIMEAKMIVTKWKNKNLVK